ncbi:hypothetical protein TrST_g7129 [Triparma strigata]|uniref:C2H2-type domain-containing protein n=1 Tax=Triparma strigata TaxID=1606541 RepID=A0A9W7B3W1_9STRA|nr:hypothetical protein TrST_g7129 [Triparma strigata]
MKSAPSLLENQLFPDAKELTESFTMLSALQRFCPLPTSPPSPLPPPGSSAIIVIGDGQTPRTASLLSHIYSPTGVWCYSIDPIMSLTSSPTLSSDSPSTPGSNSPHSLGRTWGTIKNLLVHRGPIEELYINCETCTIIMMHAHVSIPQVLASLSSNIKRVHAVITCPCCDWGEKQVRFQGRYADVKGDDYGCWSDKREIRIWLNDDGTRRGFYNHLTVGEWDKKVYEEKGGVEKNWVRMLREQGRSWSLAKTAEEAWEVANGFYEKYPSHFGDTSNLPKLGAAADYPIMVSDGEKGVQRMYQFTGTVTSRARCLGRKLLFLTVILKGGIKLQVKVTDQVLTDELYPGAEEEGVRINSKLLDAALRGNLTVRVTGYPQAFKVGVGLLAIGLKIHIPKPSLEVIKSRMEHRRNTYGMWRKDAGFYTEEGGLRIETWRCGKCGKEVGDVGEYDQHLVTHHGITRV